MRGLPSRLDKDVVPTWSSASATVTFFHFFLQMNQIVQQHNTGLGETWKVFQGALIMNWWYTQFSVTTVVMLHQEELTNVRLNCWGITFTLEAQGCASKSLNLR